MEGTGLHEQNWISFGVFFGGRGLIWWYEGAKSPLLKMSVLMLTTSYKEPCLFQGPFIPFRESTCLFVYFQSFKGGLFPAFQTPYFSKQCLVGERIPTLFSLGGFPTENYYFFPSPGPDFQRNLSQIPCPNPKFFPLSLFCMYYF